MKKLISILCLLGLFSACFGFQLFKKKVEPVLILSDKNPYETSDISEAQNRANVFKINKRIYFTFHTEDGFKSDYVKYQIVRQDDNAYTGGYTRIMNITKRLSDKYTFSDYFTLSRCGRYYIQIFDITNLNHWLKISSFMVVE